MSIKIILTGGTIDSYWEPSKDTVVVNNQTVIPEFIEKFIRPNTKIDFETITMKDSRDITDEIRKNILIAIEKSSQDRIIITHGTYTMPLTAQYLKEHLSKEALNKKIILTGAFYPLQGFSPNDAGFNLGFAIACSLNAKSGVYVAMNAELFDANHIEKDIEKGIFKEK